jgi:hypothetical protein
MNPWSIIYPLLTQEENLTMKKLLQLWKSSKRAQGAICGGAH